jgi:hypothetical protein
MKEKTVDYKVDDLVGNGNLRAKGTKIYYNGIRTR